MSVEVEARVNGGSGILAGDAMQVSVGGYIATVAPIPAILLETLSSNVVAELNLDSRADGSGEYLFPAGFPDVVRGTTVEATVPGRPLGVISCNF